jgi:hypothetical protein
MNSPRNPPSEELELTRNFRHRTCDRRGPRGQAEAIKDLTDRFGRVDDCNDSHPGAATITSQRVGEEYAFEKFRPGVVARPHARVAFSIFGLKGTASARRGRARAMSRRSAALPVRCRERLRRGGRGQAAMVRVRNELGRRHERMPPACAFSLGTKWSPCLREGDWTAGMARERGVLARSRRQNLPSRSGSRSQNAVIANQIEPWGRH